MLLRNVAAHLPDCTVSQFRRLQCESSPPLEPEIFCVIWGNYEYYCLECDGVQPGPSLPTFRRNISLNNHAASTVILCLLPSCTVYSSTVKMTAVRPSETSSFCQITRRHIPEDSILICHNWWYRVVKYSVLNSYFFTIYFNLYSSLGISVLHVDEITFNHDITYVVENKVVPVLN